jgi:hypothetical protein
MFIGLLKKGVHRTDVTAAFGDFIKVSKAQCAFAEID